MLLINASLTHPPIYLSSSSSSFMTQINITALRSAIIKIFKESDDDGNGYLTVDEFMLQFKQFDKLFTALLDRLPNPLILGTVDRADHHY